MKLTVDVNFTNVLCSDSKSAKNTVKLSAFLRVKAAVKMLTNLTPDVNFTNIL